MQAWEDDRCPFLVADEEMKGSGWLNFPWWMLGRLKAGVGVGNFIGRTEGLTS
jgi:hypothetical protein